MILSPNQIQELLSILDRYTLTFIAYNVGTQVLSTKDKSILTNAGVDYKSIPKDISVVEHAFKFGLLSEALGKAAVTNMNYEQLKQYIKTGKMFKLNALETAALRNIKMQTYNDITRLTSRIKSQITDELVFADKKRHTVKHSKLVMDAAAKAIADRKSVTEVTSIIGKKTQQWNRDLARISDYVMHTAFDEGRAMMVQRKKGADALVYKDVYAGACPHCQRLYTTAGVGSQPILFKLYDLKQNGTNVGRKVKELKPVIGPTHPYCRCTLMDPPNGFTLEGLKTGEWYWDGSQFVHDKTKWTRKVKRRSKVKVTVNGKTTEI